MKQEIKKTNHAAKISTFMQNAEFADLTQITIFYIQD